MNIQEQDQRNSEYVKLFHLSITKLNNAMKHLNEQQSRHGVEQ